jgi:hypothetical protein
MCSLVLPDHTGKRFTYENCDDCRNLGFLAPGRTCAPVQLYAQNRNHYAYQGLSSCDSVLLDARLLKGGTLSQRIRRAGRFTAGEALPLISGEGISCAGGLGFESPRAYHLSSALHFLPVISYLCSARSCHSLQST